MNACLRLLLQESTHRYLLQYLKDGNTLLDSNHITQLAHFHLLCIREQSYYALKIGFTPDAEAPCSIIATFWPIGPCDSARMADTTDMLRSLQQSHVFPLDTSRKLNAG